MIDQSKEMETEKNPLGISEPATDEACGVLCRELNAYSLAKACCFHAWKVNAALPKDVVGIKVKKVKLFYSAPES